MARDLPQYISQLNLGSLPKVQFSNAQAETTQAISKELGAIGAGMQQKSVEMDALNAEVELKTKLMELHRQHPDNPEAFRSSYDGFKKGFFTKYKNPELQAKTDLIALPYLDRVTEQYNKNLDSAHELAENKYIKTTISSTRDIVKNINSPIPEHRKAALDALNATANDVANVAASKNSDGSFRRSPEQQMAILGDYQSEIVLSLPPEQRLEALGFTGGGFEKSMQTVWKNEVDLRNPDKVISDGNGLAKYGINTAANPDVDIEKLTPDEAVKIYKERYWDAYGIDSLPANTQSIVFDGVVNHGSDFSRKLVKAAKEGAAPSELLEMRRAEYERLANADPKKYGGSLRGWENRLAKLSHFAVGEMLDYIPTSKRAQLAESTMKEIQADRELMQNNPVKWGNKRGMTIDEIVSMQSDRLTMPAVIEPDTAKGIVEQFKAADSLDKFSDAAQGLISEYGPYTRNAINDLRKEKLPPEIEEALLLASRNPNSYRNHISNLFFASKVSDDDLNKGLKEMGEDSALINEKVSSAIADEPFYQIQNFEYSPEKAGEYMIKQTQVMQKAVKAYMYQNRGASVSEAIEFVTNPDVSEYKIGYLNGNPFKIPANISTDAVEERLNMLYEQKIRKELDKIGKSGFALTVGNTVPVLNEDGQSYRFVDLDGTPLFDADGKAVTVSLDDIYKTQTRKEISATLGALPYNEREKKRMEMFGQDIDDLEQIKKNYKLRDKMMKPVGMK